MSGAHETSPPTCGRCVGARYVVPPAPRTWAWARFSVSSLEEAPSGWWLGALPPWPRAPGSCPHAKPPRTRPHTPSADAGTDWVQERGLAGRLRRPRARIRTLLDPTTETDPPPAPPREETALARADRTASSPSSHCPTHSSPPALKDHPTPFQVSRRRNPPLGARSLRRPRGAPVTLTHGS